MSNNGLSRECLERLKRFDSCTLANAIERLKIRPRNEGFVVGATQCRFPKLPPVVGHAVTGRMRSSMPPIDGRWYYHNIDWWQYLVSVPPPRIVVMEDADRLPGTGALFGEIHARICRALGCVAYVTDGAVRDLPGIETLGFQVFARSVAVSHAYAHVMEFGDRVEIGGLRISSGDLIHGDLHGLQTIPQGIAAELPDVAGRILLQEEEWFHMCNDKNFSIEKLAARLEEEDRERQACD